jgi:hypothetical protein
MTGWKEFKKYALSHGVHNGPSTIAALHDLYEKHKGSKYSTIVALFKVHGRLSFLKSYNKEMGYK